MKGVSFDVDVVRGLLVESVSYADLLRKMDLGYFANFKKLKKFVKKNGLCDTHFTGKGSNPNSHIKKGGILQKIPLIDVLVENSDYARGLLKRRLVLECGWAEQCGMCGLGTTWNNEKIVHHLDHINGVSDDNRIENLRFLCPNCHSQTPSYAGRNRQPSTRLSEKKVGGRGWSRIPRKPRKKRVHKTPFELRCHYCDNKFSSRRATQHFCSNACLHNSQRRSTRPSLAVLQQETNELGFSAVGRKYGVSDNAIRKWMKQK